MRERKGPQLDFKKPLKSDLVQDWPSLIAHESHLLPFVQLQQRTMRLAGIIPDWSNFEFGEVGWSIKKKVDSRDWRKLRAWWTAIYRVQRKPDDEESIKLALAYVVQEKVRSNGKRMPVDPAAFGIDDLQHIHLVLTTVHGLMGDLLPREVGPEADASALLRPKYSKRQAN